MVYNMGFWASYGCIFVVMEKRKKNHIHYLTYFNSVVVVVFLITFLVVVFSDFLSVPIELVTKEVCDSNGENCETNLDVINIAVQLGRLDFVSICLAILGSAIAMGAIFAFFSIKEQAEVVAGRAVRQKWKYWENDVMPKLIIQNVEKWLEDNVQQIADDTADDIAASVDEDTTNA